MLTLFAKMDIDKGTKRKSAESVDNAAVQETVLFYLVWNGEWQLAREIILDILCSADFVTQLKLQKVCKYWMHLLNLPPVVQSIHTGVGSFNNFADKLSMEKQFPVVRNLTLCGHAHQNLTDITINSFKSLFHSFPQLQHIIIREVIVCGSTPQSYWTCLLETHVESLRWSISSSKYQLTVAGPQRVNGEGLLQPLFVNSTWHVPLADGVYGTLRGFTEAVQARDAAWWPYGSAQKCWLKSHAKLLKNDHYWIDWVKINYNLPHDRYRNLLLSEAFYGNLDLLTGYEASRIFCSMAAFILRRGTKYMQWPEEKFAFEMLGF